MEVRVMVQLLAPGVEDSQAADLRAKVLGAPAMSWKVCATV